MGVDSSMYPMTGHRKKVPDQGFPNRRGGLGGLLMQRGVGGDRF